ncbi:MAG: signal recognition particle receptor subunit alpha, partial [Thermosphaera sp.]
MFKKIKEAFRKFIDSASSIIFSREKLKSLIDELKLELVASDVAYEVAEEISARLLKAVDEGLVKSREDLQRVLKNILIEVFEKAGSVNLLDVARANKPCKLVFLGVNGVGKTTTIAKVAVLLRENGFKPLMVAADTFRAGAQEQLKIH